MAEGMAFRVGLILLAALALLAIIMHYNNAVSASSRSGIPEGIPSGYYETFQGTETDIGVPGSVEDVYSMPAPVELPAPPVKAPPGPPGPAQDVPKGDALRPQDLLPVVGNTPEEQQFAQLYATGQGDMQGINFLDAGSQIGLSTRLNRNANLQLRSDPPIVKQSLPFLFSTIEADRLRKPLEIGSQSTAVPAELSM